MTEVTEIPQDPIETKLTVREKEIAEALDRIDNLYEIEYPPGFEDSVGYFPALEDIPERPVLARFSYGKNAPNMSAVFFDKSEGSQESEVTGERNTREFLEAQGFIGYPSVIQVLGKFEGVEPQIEEVSLDTLKDKTKVVGNLIFTRDPRITLIIKPADCPTAIIYCKDKDGNPMIAINHGGADAINAGVTRQGLWALQDEYGVDLSEAKIVIFPGVFPENFFITNEPERRGNGIVERNWGEYITEKETKSPSEKRFVDITSAFEMQAIQAGIKPENIQSYRVNTYADAAQGKAYSRRYSNEHGGAHPGGQLLAVALNPQYIQEAREPLAKAA